MENKMEPIIAGKKPIKVDLEEGKNYFWRRCGRPATQPFCNGSHRGTQITPLKLTSNKTASLALCQ
jgi:CDGSH-type Zn-finger protein